MPLSTLEIPQNQYASLSVEGRQQSAINVCNKAIDLAHEQLRIPDPEDREVRLIVDSDVTNPRIILSFTVGPNEYPKYPRRESLMPSPDNIKKLGAAIHTQARVSPFKVTETRMEPWSNTTYRMYSPEEPVLENSLTPPEDRRDTIGRFVKEPNVKIFLSPDVLGAPSLQKEMEPDIPTEIEHFQMLAAEVYKVVEVSLGIPEETKGTAETFVVEYADAPISVEFDCQPDADHLINEDVRSEVIGRIEHLLRTNSATKEFAGEIWFRQGQPSTEIITS